MVIAGEYRCQKHERDDFIHVREIAQGAQGPRLYAYILDQHPRDETINAVEAIQRTVCTMHSRQI